MRSLLEGYQKKQFTVTEVVQASLKAIDLKNPKLNALLEVNAEKALTRARALDADISKASEKKLFGVPIAIKDNILVKDWQCTAGSKILEGYRAPYTATTVQRLEAEGAVIIGKANCDEFAMGSSNETSHYGSCRNPWDLERVPGGSSGGSAAAVAAGMCPASLGTDTGGSIRQPASLCGLVGLKPSYGRVSRYGVVSYASSLDQVGPFSRTVWDCARLLEVLSGADKKDATTSHLEVPPYAARLQESSLSQVTLGVAPQWLQGVDADVKEAFDRSIEQMKKEGAKIVEIDLPRTRYSLSVYYLIAPSEASSNLARYDGVHYGFRAKEFKDSEQLYNRSRGQGFGKEVKLRIMLGTYALSAGYYDAFYLKANQVRRLIQQDFEAAFQKCDAVLVPTSPSTAFKLGEKTDDPLKMYLSDIFTLPVNLAGLPGVSVPCGLDKKNLPIGLQLIGRPFEELKLLQIAQAHEKIQGVLRLP
ncbi:MAG: Asp-tRNA(Asn)/Glu-tRNA(Gln) amidotransferase subunit GatA [Proteobacteria bacterium]|nr:Asp-tRNA(Asn)/Glu-tRNA(Gln) amidotransferase subunit GatA [Pseudomonadota bacterium]NDC23708.1 Asp-tRNA(Asn)/Glu-tRNA(Gln) amidotransferase subunit GatA [Pseudomonadota bacterium]NDD03953.1 Asp-tRNA(Asn)/Glu-tRNA(Gln) amidotransferase subunit GatA [Pseudomonadota bacterium]NDG26687.1 Asp-tRNA(Asn)/Glu-tRNA(Gln) amidotransferase subunit GatA [Pseudomonadota bacterium]